MGSASSNAPQEEGEDDFINMEYIRGGVVTSIPNEVKPRPKIGRNPKSGSKSNSKIKNESLRSALSIDLDNPEAEKIRKEFEMFRLNKENELANFKRKEKKLETENRKLKTELQALQKTCKKLRDERDQAFDAEQRALMRAAAIETDRDKVQRQFKIFRETKEGELQNLLKLKRNLESKIMKIDPSLLESETNFQKDDDAGSGDVWAAVDTLYSPRATGKNEAERGCSDDNKWHSKSMHLKVGQNLQSHSNLVTFFWFACSGCPDKRDDHFILELKTVLERCCIHSGNYTLDFFKLSSDDSAEDIEENCNLLVRILSMATNSYFSGVIFTDVASTNHQHMKMIESVMSLQLPVSIFCTLDDVCKDREDVSIDKCKDFQDLKNISGLKKLQTNSLISFSIAFSMTDLIHELEKILIKKLQSKYQHYELKCLNFLGWGDIWKWQEWQNQLFHECNSKFDSPHQFKHHNDSCQKKYSLPLNRCLNVSWLDKYVIKINNHISSPGPIPPLVVRGDAGSGKTTLLTKWIDQYNKRHSTTFVLSYSVVDPHHPSSDPVVLIKCLMFQILQCFSTPFALMLDHSKLFRDFPRWLEKVSTLFPGGVLLILDSIDYVKNFEVFFNWLMDPLPIDLRVVISLRSNSCPNSWRSWPLLLLHPMTENECGEYVDLLLRDSFGLGKEVILNHLYSNPPLCFPLATYLASVISLLSGSGITNLSSCKTLKDLYVAFINILDEKSDDASSLLKEFFGLLSCCHHGLTLSELVEVIEGSESMEPKALFDIVDCALENGLLKNICGLIVVESDQVRMAIDEWLLGKQDKNENLNDDSDIIVSSMKKLMRYHSSKASFPNFSPRSVLELASISCRLQDLEKLKSIVCDFEFCLTFLRRNLSSELMDYWQLLDYDLMTFASNLDLKIQEYQQRMENSGYLQQRLIICYEEVGKFFAEQGLNEKALEILLKSVELHHHNDIFDHLRMGQINNLLGQIHDKLGRKNAAENFYLSALTNFQYVLKLNKINNGNSSDHEQDLDMIVDAGKEKWSGHQCNDDYNECKGDGDVLARYHYQHLVAAQLDLLASFHLKQGRLEMSDNLVKKVSHLRSKINMLSVTSKVQHVVNAVTKSSNKELIKQRLEELMQQTSGNLDDLSLAGVEHELGVLQASQGNYRDAENFLKRSLDKRESLLSGDDVLIIQSLNSLIVLYARLKQFHKVEELTQRLLRSIKKDGGQNPDLLVGTLKNIVYINQSIGRLDKAEVYLEMLIDAVDQNSVSLEYFASLLANLAVVCSQQGKHSKADPLHQRALNMYRSLLPPKHPRILETARNLALSKYEQGDLEIAAQLYQLTIDDKTPSPLTCSPPMTKRHQHAIPR